MSQDRAKLALAWRRRCRAGARDVGTTPISPRVRVSDADGVTDDDAMSGVDWVAMITKACARASRTPERRYLARVIDRHADRIAEGLTERTRALLSAILLGALGRHRARAVVGRLAAAGGRHHSHGRLGPSLVKWTRKLDRLQSYLSLFRNYELGHAPRRAPPPPQMRALTTSTLTAAPPAPPAVHFHAGVTT